MTRLIAAAFAAALVSSSQAMPLAPLPSDDTLMLVRDACGAGMHRVNGVCTRTPAHRHAGRVLHDPHAHAMETARKTWPGRPLCDEGGYRIRPCDMVPSIR
jgi:hypothetical protein